MAADVGMCDVNESVENYKFIKICKNMRGTKIHSVRMKMANQQLMSGRKINKWD